MCGIAGLLLAGEEPERMADARRRVGGMSRLLAHRGPDDSGLEASGPMVLGHRRLSILDLSALGRQPMSTADGRLWIVHNGEVYNYLELRDELSGHGYVFRSNTDTEVILAAYHRWGEGLLDRLNGMWAFAIWDAAERRLFCARDRFGIKPFYYMALPDGTLGFASEPKAFRALDAWPPEPDPVTVYHYLAGGVLDHTERTFFRGVRSLPAAHCFRIGPGEAPRPRRWWDAGDPEPLPDGRDDEVVSRVRETLLDSVRLRLRSDVPVGTCLSGGLDSSAVVGAVADLRSRTGARAQHTFSACFTEARVDERPFMDLVLAKTGATPHRVFPTAQSFLEDLDTLVWHQDEPFGSTSIHAQYGVFGLVRKAGVIVTLDGQAADELLGGYDTHHGSMVLDLFRRGSWLAAWREARALARMRGRPVRRVLKEARRQAKRQGGRRRSPPGWLSSELVDLRDDEAPHAVDRAFRAGTLQGHLWRDLTRTVLPALLRYADRNSMAHSVESRFPYLDVRFVELARRLHPRHLMRDGWTKWVLREAGADWLPPEVRFRRDKVGFEPPEREWFRGGLGDRFEEILADSPHLGRWCRTDAVRRDWRAFRAGNGGYRSAFFRLLNLDLWHRQLPNRKGGPPR